MTLIRGRRRTTKWKHRKQNYIWAIDPESPHKITRAKDAQIPRKRNSTNGWNITTVDIHQIATKIMSDKTFGRNNSRRPLRKSHKKWRKINLHIFVTKFLNVSLKKPQRTKNWEASIERKRSRYTEVCFNNTTQLTLAKHQEKKPFRINHSNKNINNWQKKYKFTKNTEPGRKNFENVVFETYQTASSPTNFQQEVYIVTIVKRKEKLQKSEDQQKKGQTTLTQRHWKWMEDQSNSW